MVVVTHEMKFEGATRVLFMDEEDCGANTPINF